MNDAISQASSAFQKERGLSLVERGGLVALVLGFIIIALATTNYIKANASGPYGCGPYACCSNTIGTATS